MRLKRIFLGGFDEIPEPAAHGFMDINGDHVEDNFSALVSMNGFLSASGGAGCIVATAEDAAVFWDALFAGQLVDVDKMLDWVARTDGNQHGLGMLKIELDGCKLIGHRGNTGGFSCAAWHVPQHDLTISVWRNKNGLHLNDVVTLILKAATD